MKTTYKKKYQEFKIIAEKYEAIYLRNINMDSKYRNEILVFL